MEITVLIENHECVGLQAEHGLSLHIRHDGKQYLLDAGQTGAFLENAVSLGIDLGEVDICALSHGHYDHAGGFAVLLERFPDKTVYASARAFEEYASGSGGAIHDIGIPENVKQYQERFHLVKAVQEIEKGVYLIPHGNANLASIGERTKLYVKRDGVFVPDDFAHEISLVFDTKSGLVIFNSCSHGGIRTIIEEVTSVLPGRKLWAFLGGLHMKGRSGGVETCTFSAQEVDELSDYIFKSNLEHLYTGHCTGDVAYNMLKERLGDIICPLNTGARICPGKDLGDRG